MMIGKTLACAILPALLLAASAGVHGGWAQSAGGDSVATGDDVGSRTAAGWRGPGSRLCRIGRGWRLERMTAVVEGLADLNETQLAAWTAFRTAADSAQTTVREACEAMAGQDRPATGPARLERMESMLSLGLEAVRKMRPTYVAFYRTLDEKQQKALDSLGRPGWRPWRRHR